MRHGCIYTNRRGRKIKFLLILLILFLFAAQSINASTTASLAITVSIVEGDLFGPGNSLHTVTEIRNSAASGRIDVVLTYEIMDINGQSIVVETTTVAIETLSSFSEELTLPKTMEEGTYILKASVTSLDGSKYSEASRSLTVVHVSENLQKLIEYVMQGALLFTGVILIYEHRRVTKLKISNKDLKKFIESQK